MGWLSFFDLTFSVRDGTIIPADAGVARELLGLERLLRVQDMYVAWLESHGVRSNPSRVRPNGSAAVALDDRTAVDDGRDGALVVTMRRYGGKQWFGIAEWIPARGRGFDVAFSYHESERATRMERADAQRLSDALARKLERLAREAVGSGQ
jgi:hypothetical protein